NDGGVVFVHGDALGAAEIRNLHTFQLDAGFFEDRTATSQNGDIFQHGLRRSPKPGAFTAATFSVPRSLFTTRVASASPSTSSAIMRSGRPERATCSSTG